jgi:DNA-binding MarR family transcriptional regulator
VALKKLEGKGLVTKTASPEDGRRSIIRLTELGVKINKAHMYFHRRLAKNAGYDMTEPEKEILLSATAKLARFLREKADGDAAPAGQEREAQSKVKVEG